MLTGLMILIFLHDVRSVIVVLVSIPLSLTTLVGRPVAYRQHDQHHVVGRTGVGHRHSRRRGDGHHRKHPCANASHDSIARAARRANATTATARLLAMLCILSVFIPTFILNEPVRSLFMPLTLAVGFSMIASYLLSSTLVPVLTVWLMRHRGEAAHQEGFFDRFLPRFASIVEVTVRRRWLVVPTYLVGCGLLLWLVGRQVGTELFPQVDSGQFVLRFRAPTRLRVRADAEMRDQGLGGDRRADAGQRGDFDGLRRAWARPTRRRTTFCCSCGAPTTRSSACGCKKGSGVRLGRTARTPAQGAAGELVPWLKTIAGTGRVLARGGARPGRKKFPSVSSRATSSAR